MPEATPGLSVPPEGLRGPSVVLRFPTLDDVDALLPAFTDPEGRDADVGEPHSSPTDPLLPRTPRLLAEALRRERVPASARERALPPQRRGPKRSDVAPVALKRPRHPQSAYG
jgi:hypothetical protein